MICLFVCFDLFCFFFLICFAIVIDFSSLISFFVFNTLHSEIPYKGVDAGAVIWGVGSNSLHLPIPSTAPDGFTLLLKQCWNAEPKHRPEFRQIQVHLDILAEDTSFITTPHKTYFAAQEKWRLEMVEKFEVMKHEETEIRRLDEQLIK